MAQARARSWGQRRTALVVCMQCADTMGRWPTWDQDPASVIAREGRGYGLGHRDDRRELLDRELRAIALLIEAHPDEFTATVAGLAETTQLAAARRAKRRRA